MMSDPVGGYAADGLSDNARIYTPGSEPQGNSATIISGTAQVFQSGSEPSGFNPPSETLPWNRIFSYAVGDTVVYYGEEWVAVIASGGASSYFPGSASGHGAWTPVKKNTKYQSPGDWAYGNSYSTGAIVGWQGGVWQAVSNITDDISIELDSDPAWTYYSPPAWDSTVHYNPGDWVTAGELYVSTAWIATAASLSLDPATPGQKKWSLSIYDTYPAAKEGSLYSSNYVYYTGDTVTSYGEVWRSTADYNNDTGLIGYYPDQLNPSGNPWWVPVSPTTAFVRPGDWAYGGSYPFGATVMFNGVYQATGSITDDVAGPQGYQLTPPNPMWSALPGFPWWDSVTHYSAGDFVSTEPLDQSAWFALEDNTNVNPNSPGQTAWYRPVKQANGDLLTYNGPSYVGPALGPPPELGPWFTIYTYAAGDTAVLFDQKWTSTVDGNTYQVNGPPGSVQNGALTPWTPAGSDTAYHSPGSWVYGQSYASGRVVYVGGTLFTATQNIPGPVIIGTSAGDTTTVVIDGVSTTFVIGGDVNTVPNTPGRKANGTFSANATALWTNYTAPPWNSSTSYVTGNWVTDTKSGYGYSWVALSNNSGVDPQTTGQTAWYNPTTTSGLHLGNNSGQ